MANSANVSTARPKIGGAVYCAPVGTPLPTSADATLNGAFKQLGYISEDGLTNSNAPSNTDIKAWGGDIVLSATNERPDTFNYKLLEVLNIDVLKSVYGTAKVTGTSLASGITVKATSEDVEDMEYVVDMIMNGGILKRLVVSRAKLSGLGDISYKTGDACAYDITITAYPDADGVTHYEYIKAPAGTYSDEKKILGFAINNCLGTIDESAHEIAVEVPAATVVTALAPMIMVSTGATVSPASGQSMDFTNAVTYTVTAEDGTTQAYEVTVTVGA